MDRGEGRVRRRFLATLLLFYPRAFRERYGRDILADLSRLLGGGSKGAQSGPKAGLWLRAFGDAARHGSIERMSALRSSRDQAMPRTSRQSGAATQDLRQALRSLSKAPVFTLVAVLTLSIGIGATTAIFSVIDGVLLEALPFPQPDRLVGLWHVAPGLRADEMNQSPATFYAYQEQNRTFESIGLWDNRRVTITGFDEPERVRGLLVTEQFLPTLDYPLALGRNFALEDDQPNAPGTVILNHHYWTARFGSDPEVIGKVLTLDGNPVEVIGVMARDFPFAEYSVLVPARFDRGTITNGDFSYQAIGRLLPGVTLAEAEADLARLLPSVARDYPGRITPAVLAEGRFAPVVRALKDDFVGDVRAVLWILFGAVSIILLIACANVANLYLARAEGRQREVAVRAALGAGRRGILRYFLIESLVLALLAGAVGVALAAGGVRLLAVMVADSVPGLPDIGIDPTVLAFALVASIASGVAFGIFPALRYRDNNLVAALKGGGRGGSSGRHQHRVRNGLVVAQMALAVILLVSAGLMLRSFQTLRAVDPGFERPDELITVRLDVPEAVVADPLDVAAVHEQVLLRLRQLAGVTSVAATSSVTMDGNDSHNAIYVEDHPVEPGVIPEYHRVKSVSGDYTATMGIPLVAGRALHDDDLRDRRRVVQVTEAFALTYWPDAPSALGKRIGFADGDWWEVVGVSADVLDDGMDQPIVSIVYFPAVRTRADGSVSAIRSLTHVVRSSLGTQLAAQIREAVWSVNPNLPVTGLGSHAEVVERSLARTVFTMAILGIAGLVALGLGTIGIYGVISYVVSRRTREIGVRIALGADQAAVSGLIVRQGMRLAGLGVAIGVIVAAGVTQLLSSVLYGVSPLDPTTFVSVAVGLAAVALVATYLPARRAAAVDPIRALRWE